MHTDTPSTNTPGRLSSSGCRSWPLPFAVRQAHHGQVSQPLSLVPALGSASFLHGNLAQPHALHTYSYAALAVDHTSPPPPKADCKAHTHMPPFPHLNTPTFPPLPHESALSTATVLNTVASTLTQSHATHTTRGGEETLHPPPHTHTYTHTQRTQTCTYRAGSSAVGL